MLFGNILLARAKGIEVSNDDTLTLFDDRVSVTPPLVIGSSEYLTGTYQQPDRGTYAGDINDLTEGQIDDLAAGNDYDGLGTSVIWSTLEKVWVLENLETTSTSGILRYGFSFTYDSGISEIKVLNSGSLGLIPVSDRVLVGLVNAGGVNTTDWVDTNTDGLADNWTVLNIPTATIVTGNGFTGNAQRVDRTALTQKLISPSISVSNGGSYILSFTYRTDLINGGSDGFYAVVKSGGAINVVSLELATNTGDALFATTGIIKAIDSSFTVEFWTGVTGSDAKYFEVDAVNIINIATSDWVDSNADGLGDDWALVGAGGYSFTTVTGNGFAKNAQRLDKLNTNNAFISSDNFDLKLLTDYIIVVRYRTNDTGTTTDAASISVIQETGAVNAQEMILPEHTDDAIVLQSDVFQVTETDVQIWVRCGTNEVGDWLEIDEIELIEV